MDAPLAGLTRTGGGGAPGVDVGVGRGRCPLANVGLIQSKSSAVPNTKDFVANIGVHDATLIGTEIESGKVKKLLLSCD